MSNSKLRAKEDAPRENNREPALDWGGQGRPPEEITPKLQCESARRSQPGGAGKNTSERGEGRQRPHSVDTQQVEEQTRTNQSCRI